MLIFKSQKLNRSKESNVKKTKKQKRAMPCGYVLQILLLFLFLGSHFPVGVVPPRTKSPTPESSTIASYVTLRKTKKMMDSRTVFNYPLVSRRILKPIYCHIYVRLNFRGLFWKFFLAHHTACRISVLRPGIKPMPPEVEVRSANH